MFVKTLRYLWLLALATSVLAADPPQRTVKKINVWKRDNLSSMADGLRVGAPCGDITGNSDDIICEVDSESISCAPVCCMQKKKFVDGCPKGDECVFEDNVLRCCPPGSGEDCGPRPTACANFGRATRRGEVMCPSATPTCVTREDGGAACTGSDDKARQTRESSAQPTEQVMDMKSVSKPRTTVPSSTQSPDNEDNYRPDPIPSDLIYPTVDDTPSPSPTAMVSSDSSSDSTTITVSVSESMATGMDPPSTNPSPADATTVLSNSNSGTAEYGFGRNNPAFGLLIALALAFGAIL